jgi:anti-anti-sigma regulatory factor
MPMIRPASMMAAQTARDGRERGERMVPRSMLLVLTDDRRTGPAPVDGGRRNKAAAAFSWLLPLPDRNATRPRASRPTMTGCDVRVLGLNGEDGRLRVRRCWSGAIIELVGEHDLTTAMTVEHCLRDALARGSVVVDVSAAALIDCSILGAFRRAADLDGAHGMVVCAPPGTCPRRLIDVAASSSDLDLAVYDTRGQALSAAAMWVR